ncbi:hypothetical protein SCLCIDRAFT_1225000 [Scleroderma citrinum Foug A]|uniref:Uncharacterized protein n=1 Tax=Scleroderma citrinum Foug A TaxID=1036808 RepID=A0A0C2YMD1_9AGAM|nr:hypothetical protein SCLCIDRAFT_1225000 [Scleroderma citrinum Foug A]
MISLAVETRHRRESKRSRATSGEAVSSACLVLQIDRNGTKRALHKLYGPSLLKLKWQRPCASFLWHDQVLPLPVFGTVSLQCVHCYNIKFNTPIPFDGGYLKNPIVYAVLYLLVTVSQ